MTGVIAVDCLIFNELKSKAMTWVMKVLMKIRDILQNNILKAREGQERKVKASFDNPQLVAITLDITSEVLIAVTE